MTRAAEGVEAELREVYDAHYGRLAGWTNKLVSDPDLLFLDEPTTGLDPQARLKLWDMIEQFRAGGGTIINAWGWIEPGAWMASRSQSVGSGRGLISVTATTGPRRARISLIDASPHAAGRGRAGQHRLSGRVFSDLCCVRSRNHRDRSHRCRVVFRPDGRSAPQRRPDRAGSRHLRRDAPQGGGSLGCSEGNGHRCGRHHRIR